MHEAVKWYKKAADQGHAEAQNNYGVALFRGKGIRENMDEAVKWYKKAADQGLAVAQFHYGNALFRGKGIRKNMHEAVKWYKKAADQGDSVAQYHYGYALLTGQGISPNMDEAAEWYKKAADQGNVIARHELAKLPMFSTSGEIYQNNTSQNINSNNSGSVMRQMPHPVPLPQLEKGKGKEASLEESMPEHSNASNTVSIGEPSSSTVQGVGLELAYKGALKMLQGEEVMRGIRILESLAKKGFQKAKDFLSD
jgi:TPR repeat protein